MTDVFDPARLDAIRSRQVFDKARLILAERDNHPDFIAPTDAEIVARALLAYEPTPDATEEAQKIFDEIINYGKHGYGATLIAAAIARATAASEARVRELEAALRMLAIVQHVRMVQGGGLVTNGKSCKVCKTEWDDDAPEKHADNCVLHHTDTVGGAR